MKITSDYELKKRGCNKLKNGDVVFMRGLEGSASFYGIYSYGVGIIELENGSNAYASTKEQLFLGSTINYWTVAKIFRNCELIIRE